MNKHIILFACVWTLYSFPCSGIENDDMVIDSGEAGYKDNKITLSGHVVIEHELGTLEAEYMELTPEMNDNRIRARNLTMENHVSIGLKDGGQLCCSFADVDFQLSQGVFKGDSQQEYVTYTELCKGKSGANIPVVVKSRQMTVQLARAKNQPSKGNAISSILAEDDVTVNYNDDFMAAADHAAYHRLENALQHTQMKGMISLRAEGEEGTCQITNRNGDMITADHLCIDTTQRQISFVYPKGALCLSHETPEHSRIDFSSDTLTWEDAQNTLKLREHVNIYQQGMGTLASDKDVTLSQEIVEEKKRLVFSSQHRNHCPDIQRTR